MFTTTGYSPGFYPDMSFCTLRDIKAVKAGGIDDLISFAVNSAFCFFDLYRSEWIVGDQCILAGEIIKYLALACIRQPDDNDFLKLSRIAQATPVPFLFSSQYSQPYSKSP